MIKNTILILNLLCCGFFQLRAQISKDSINTYLAKYPKKDTNRIKALLELSGILSSNFQFKPSIAFAEEGLKLAKDLKQPKFIFSAMCDVGTARVRNAQTEEGTKNYLEALALEPVKNYVFLNMR